LFQVDGLFNDHIIPLTHIWQICDACAPRFTVPTTRYSHLYASHGGFDSTIRRAIVGMERVFSGTRHIFTLNAARPVAAYPVHQNKD
jgi:hypothetical protein